MAVKIRLARHGRKRKPFYHIVVADSRSPRDGRIIERIGSYNPNINPAVIDLDIDKAVEWMFKGAQPTTTAKRILSYKGVLIKKHLLVGAKKGAFTEEEALAKFDVWVAEKEAQIQAKVENLAKNSEIAVNKKIEAEKEVNEKRAEGIASRKAELAAEAKAKADEEAKATEAADSAETDEAPEAKTEEKA